MRCTITAITALLHIGTIATAQDVGLTEFSVSAPHHEREMDLAVFYPATGEDTDTFAENAVFYGTDVLADPTPKPGPYPAVLLSHGWGGIYARMAWLGAALAAEGAVVIAVNHPNSTTFDIDFATAFNHWTRAQDLSHALDVVLEAPELGALIDRDRIYAAGFSFGGWTALSLGGATGTRAGFFAYCNAAGAGSQFCAMLDRAGVDITAIDADQYGASYKDHRIKAVAAIDPGLTWGLSPENVADLVPNVLLIGLGAGEDRLHPTDTSESGSGFDSLVPHASKIVIAPAMHFSALGLCKPMGAAILQEEQDDPVCTDPAGTDRAQVLAQIVSAMVDHFGLRE